MRIVDTEATALALHSDQHAVAESDIPAELSDDGNTVGEGIDSGRGAEWIAYHRYQRVTGAISRMRVRRPNHTNS